MRIIDTWVPVLAACALSGCSGGKSSPDAGTPGGQEQPGRELVTVSALVPATSGGTVAFADGTGIEIPPGALAADTTIT